jgi:rRNA maturation endonuclease Nob1
MSFFDDFGKKISSVSQEAIAKTKDFADVTKLNSNISEEERKINSAYSEIGKMYFELHSDDYEECFGTQFLAIKESKEKIKDYEKQIVNIKGVVKCPNCGTEVPKTAAFCASCGSAITQEKPEVEVQEVKETVEEVDENQDKNI